MIILLGSKTPVLPYIEDAINKGILKVIKVTDKKYGEYEVLQGEVCKGKTVISFK